MVGWVGVVLVAVVRRSVLPPFYNLRRASAVSLCPSPIQ